MRLPNPTDNRRSQFGSYWTEFLEKGPQVIGAVKAGIEIGRVGVSLAETALPYIRPLVLAAALKKKT